MKHILKSFLLRSAIILTATLSLSSISLSAREYRIAYFEPGDYSYFRALQTAYRSELEELGGDSMTIIMSPTGYKSAEWKRDQSQWMAKQLARDKSFDMIVAMGPWVVEDLIAAGCETPILSMGRFDPVLEGLADESGRPLWRNLTVHIRPRKVETDFAALHALTPSKRIGVLYAPSSLDPTREWSLVSRYMNGIASKIGDSVNLVIPDSVSSVYPFFKKLPDVAGKVDVLYLTPLYGLSPEQTGGFFDEISNRKIPTFGAEGMYAVEKGAFASNAVFTVFAVAHFNAVKTLRILKGATPQSLPTAFAEGRGLSVNIEACQRLNISIPDVLLADAAIVKPPTSAGTTLGISEAVGEAKRVNPAYNSAMERIRAIGFKVGEARAELLPTLAASAYLNRFDQDPPLNAFDRFGHRRQGFDIGLTQHVLDLEKWQSLRYAKQQENRGNFQRASEDAQLGAEVVGAYAEALWSEEYVTRARESQGNVSRALEAGLTLFQMGAGDRLALLRLESLKTAAAADVLQAENLRADAMRALSALLGRPDPEAFALDETYFSSEAYERDAPLRENLRTRKNVRRVADFFVTDAAQKSPEVNIARSEVSLAEIETRSASARYFPKISAYAGYYRDSYASLSSPLDSDDRGWTIGFTAQATLFDWGATRKRHKQFRALQNAREYSRDQVALANSERIRAYVDSMASAVNRQSVALRHRDYTHEAWQEALSRFERGDLEVESLVRVIEDLNDSENEMLATRRDYFRAKLGLWRTVGYSDPIPAGAAEKETLQRLDNYLRLTPR